MLRDWILCRFSALAWLHVAWLLHVGHALPIDKIIANSMTTPYSSMYDETSQMVKVELDMLFTVEDWTKLISLNNSLGGHTRLHKRQAIWEGAGGRYWPGGIIYYEIDPYAFDPEEVGILHEAMYEWMRYTCIRFRPATRTTLNKLRFGDGDGCASNVGMVKNNRVTLAKGCRKKGVVMHELGHALGFHHEQTRPDRDHYVKIHLDKIPTYMRYNFRKYTWAIIRDLGVPYDYLSIMHYSKSAFSATDEMTIETRDKKYQDLIGNRRRLSFRDIKSANILYKCKPRRRDCHLKDEDCPGEGFVSKHCECWCPSPDVYREIPYYVCRPNTRSVEGRASTCEDLDENCKAWATRGECTSNKGYMQVYCKRACGLCETVVESRSCRDEYDGCRSWSDKGYCRASSNFRRFMARNCRLSCGFCIPSPDPDNQIFPCERSCDNDHRHCHMWALRGECDSTPDYMQRHCRKACNMCCTAAPAVSSRSRTKRPSKDRRVVGSGGTSSSVTQRVLLRHWG